MIIDLGRGLTRETPETLSLTENRWKFGLLTSRARQEEVGKRMNGRFRPRKS